MDQPLIALGLMSGTSADGIDAALIATDGRMQIEPLGAIHLPHPDDLRREILGLYEPGAGEIDRAGSLHVRLGLQFAQAARTLCDHIGHPLERVDVIGSHGQTIRHRPGQFTLQIGCPATISIETATPTVADFRTTDMALGGQGAPLAPLYHQVRFAEPGRRIAVINLGGIANVTALTGAIKGDQDAPDGPGRLIAGDTGPASCLMDLLAEEQSGGRMRCDEGGTIAASGQVDAKALAWLMDHPYLARPFPKSTGREEFTLAYLKEFMQRFDGLSDAGRMATLAQMTIESVSDACRKLLPPHPDRMIFSGGGVHNRHLMAGFAQALPETEVTTSSALGVDSDFLEAQAFAWFAVRTLKGLPSSAPGATGASRAAVLGGIYP